jgi:hypothetical protein
MANQTNLDFYMEQLRQGNAIDKSDRTDATDHSDRSSINTISSLLLASVLGIVVTLMDSTHPPKPTASIRQTQAPVLNTTAPQPSYSPEIGSTPVVAPE